MSVSTTIKDPTEATIKNDLDIIRENFTLQKVYSIIWIPGYHNVADALTKENSSSATLRFRSLRDGILQHHLD